MYALRVVLAVLASSSVLLALEGAGRAQSGAGDPLSAECDKAVSSIEGKPVLSLTCKEVASATKQLTACEGSVDSRVQAARYEVSNAKKRCDCEGAPDSAALLKEAETADSLADYRKVLGRIDLSQRCGGERASDARRRVTERLCDEQNASTVEKNLEKEVEKASSCDRLAGRDVVLTTLEGCSKGASVKARIVERRAQLGCGTTLPAPPPAPVSGCELVKRLVDELRACDAPNGQCSEVRRAWLRRRVRTLLSTHLLVIGSRAPSSSEEQCTALLLNGLGATVPIGAHPDIQETATLVIIKEDQRLIETFARQAREWGASKSDELLKLLTSGASADQLIAWSKTLEEKERKQFWAMAGALAYREQALKNAALQEEGIGSIDVLLTPETPAQCAPLGTFLRELEARFTARQGSAWKGINLHYVPSSQFDEALRTAVKARSDSCGRDQGPGCGTVLGVQAQLQSSGDSAFATANVRFITKKGTGSVTTKPKEPIRQADFATGCDDASKQAEMEAARSLDTAILFQMLKSEGVDVTAEQSAAMHPTCGVRLDLTPKGSSAKLRDEALAAVLGSGIRISKTGVDPDVHRGVLEALKPYAPYTGKPQTSSPSLEFHQEATREVDKRPFEKYTMTLSLRQNAAVSAAAFVDQHATCGVSLQTLRFEAGRSLGNYLGALYAGRALAVDPLGPRVQTSSPWLAAGFSGAPYLIDSRATKLARVVPTAVDALLLVGAGISFSFAVHHRNEYASGDSGTLEPADAWLNVGLGLTGALIVTRLVSGVIYDRATFWHRNPPQAASR